MREIIAASSMLRTALSSHQAVSQLVTTATTIYDAALEAYRHGGHDFSPSSWLPESNLQLP
ncbi:hypothetical protein [Oligella ureolytica]|uniref:Uncharacterized protein n=1 Tax=Oligella ureolytica TaxID=90244 RepID=A0A7T3BR65_9BURK|nr:hypothetical protein [Oligella ureolytica]QPT40342.1 hypothetical protein I6G29_01575 [Oligella ureolytica]